MLHTKQIDAEAASRLFEWLDKKADFRDYALDVFRSEMNPPYMTLPGCTYYLVSDNGKRLLLIKAVPKADFLDISFSRVFNKTEKQKKEKGWEAHAWLKTPCKKRSSHGAGMQKYTR